MWDLAGFRLAVYGRAGARRDCPMPLLDSLKKKEVCGPIVILTLTYQNLQKSRVPINSILGFIITTYKNIGFGRLR